MEPGSLEVGDFNIALYPNQRPVMAMFAEGGVYKAKMFVLKAPVCANTACATCDTNGACTTCKVGMVEYQGECITCGATAPAAIFVDNGTPTCVDTSSGTYATGYGRDTTVSAFVLIKPCSVVGCSLCSANFETCTECTAGKILHLNKCTTCGTTAPTTIFVDNGTPTCVDTSSGTYSTGHGRDTTVTAFVLIKPCSVVGCSLCSANFETCTECTAGKILHLNKCTTCGTTAPTAIFVDNGTPTCVDTSSGTYSTGHGRDTTVTAFVLIKPCSVVGCSLCSANFETCTECTAGKILHLNK